MTDTQRETQPSPERTDDCVQEGTRPLTLHEIDEQTLAQLYSEFAEEDRALANAGLSEYARTLAAADEEE